MPGPLTRTETSFKPWPMAWREASCATTCATYAVDFFEPRKPHLPAEDQPMTAPVMSVIETIVLLNVAEMWAMPMKMFLLALGLDDLGLFHVVRVERQAGGNLVSRLDGGGRSGLRTFFSPAGFFSALGASRVGSGGSGGFSRGGSGRSSFLLAAAFFRRRVWPARERRGCFRSFVGMGMGSSGMFRYEVL